MPFCEIRDKIASFHLKLELFLTNDVTNIDNICASWKLIIDTLIVILILIIDSAYESATYIGDVT